MNKQKTIGRYKENNNEKSQVDYLDFLIKLFGKR